MKHKFLRLASLAAIIVGLLLLMICFVLPLIFSMQSPSLGIIGGADGPTAIVVVTRSGLQWDVLIASSLLIGGTVGLIWTRKKS